MAIMLSSAREHSVGLAGAGLLGPLCLFGTALLWSFIGVSVKGSATPPLVFSSVSAIAMAVCILAVGRPRMRFTRTVVYAGVCACIASVTFVVANSLTAVGNAIALQYTSMIFVIIYQCVGERHLPALRHVGAIIIAAAGMVLFFTGKLSASGMVGNVFAIISGAAFGMQFYLNARPDAAPMCSSFIQAVLTACLLLFQLPAAFAVPAGEWLRMVAVGVLCYGFAALLFAQGIARVAPFTANIICMSEVLMAPLWSLAIYGERLSMGAIAGAVLLTFDIIATLWLDRRHERASRRLERASSQ